MLIADASSRIKNMMRDTGCSLEKAHLWYLHNTPILLFIKDEELESPGPGVLGLRRHEVFLHARWNLLQEQRSYKQLVS